jgi:hypothetical protein
VVGLAIGAGAAVVVGAAPAAGAALVAAGAISLATAYFEGVAAYYDPAVSDDAMHEFIGEVAGSVVGCGVGFRGVGALRAGGGGRIEVGSKITKQMGPRGWTPKGIEVAVKSGNQIKAINKATGNPATRYVHPKTGQSVVVDNVTGEVIHVGGPGFKYGPGSGDLP